MDFLELVKKTRTYRRFDQSRKVDEAKLRKLVEYASFTPSPANKMPLKYILSTDSATNEKIFATLGWAGYLPDWQGPAEGEKPTAYLVMLRDNEIAKQSATDEGIQSEAIMLGATQMGLGGCIMANIKRNELREALGISERFDIALVLALGYPTERVVIESVKEDGDIKYWHDKENKNHVPKRSVDELIVKEIY